MRIVSLLSLLWSLAEVYCQIAPYVTFMGQTVYNHGYVDFSLVGDDTSGSGNNTVQCHTDLDTCCSPSQGPHRGDWYFPDGTRLDYSSNIRESRGDKRVDLRRQSNAPASPTGIFCCDIPTVAIHHDYTNSVRGTVYVGLYTASGGKSSLYGSRFFGFMVTNNRELGISYNFATIYSHSAQEI